MEKVARFLAEETGSLKVIILGSSAGEYAAVLLGSLLKADRVLTFNGQFDLEYILLDEELLRSNHIVRRCKDVESIRKYYDLRSVAEGNGSRIHYFTSAGCSLDIRQEAVAREIEGIKIFKINTDVHGIPFFLFNLRAVLDLSERELLQHPGFHQLPGRPVSGEPVSHAFHGGNLRRRHRHHGAALVVLQGGGGGGTSEIVRAARQGGNPSPADPHSRPMGPVLNDTRRLRARACRPVPAGAGFRSGLRQSD